MKPCERAIPLGLTGRTTHLVTWSNSRCSVETSAAATLANDLALCLEMSGDYEAARPLL